MTDDVTWRDVSDVAANTMDGLLRGIIRPFFNSTHVFSFSGEILFSLDDFKLPHGRGLIYRTGRIRLSFQDREWDVSTSARCVVNMSADIDRVAAPKDLINYATAEKPEWVSAIIARMISNRAGAEPDDAPF